MWLQSASLGICSRYYHTASLSCDRGQGLQCFAAVTRLPGDAHCGPSLPPPGTQTMFCSSPAPNHHCWCSPAYALPIMVPMLRADPHSRSKQCVCHRSAHVGILHCVGICALRPVVLRPGLFLPQNNIWHSSSDTRLRWPAVTTCKISTVYRHRVLPQRQLLCGSSVLA